MEWKEMSNSEIEVKLKELEFEYTKVQTEINEKYVKLNELNKNYINGKFVMEKRMNPNKIK